LDNPQITHTPTIYGSNFENFEYSTKFGCLGMHVKMWGWPNKF